MRTVLVALAVALGGCTPAQRSSSVVERALARTQLTPGQARVFEASASSVILGVPTRVRGPGTEGSSGFRVIAYDPRTDAVQELLPEAGFVRRIARGLLAVEGEELRLHTADGARMLLSHVAPDFAVDPAERFVAAVVRRPELALDTDLVLLPLEGGPARPLVSWAGSAESRPVFTPDGRAVVFVSGRSGCASLYRVELSGGAIRQLTNVGLSRPGPGFTSPPTDTSSVRWEGDALVYVAEGRTIRVPAGASR